MLKIINGNVFSNKGFENKIVYTKNDKISGKCDVEYETIDAQNMYVIPGYIDCHTHGRCGIDILEADTEELQKLSLEYLKTGVTSVYPTVMTAPLSKLKRAIRSIVKTNDKEGASFIGIHIEGPYISKKKPGCHDVSCIRKPDYDEMASLVKLAKKKKVKFTVAPEECDDGLINKLSQLSEITIGHTNCTSKQALEALNEGANCFTHTFNAMSGFTHRDPGCATAALSSEGYAEFICDGIHVDYDVIKASYKAKTKYENKMVLITDSIPAAGLKNGKYSMNGIEFELSDGKAITNTGTIVGSAISMHDAVKNAYKYGGFTLYDAVASATVVPKEMLGLKKVGEIKAGNYADLLILDKDLNIKYIINKGKISFRY